MADKPERFTEMNSGSQEKHPDGFDNQATSGKNINPESPPEPPTDKLSQEEFNRIIRGED